MSPRPHRGAEARVLAFGTHAPASGAAPARGLASAPAFIALGLLRAAVDQLDWGPSRVALGRETPRASPRLPQALVLHLAHALREGARALPERGPVRADWGVAWDPVLLGARFGADPAAVARAVEVLAAGGVLRALSGAPSGSAGSGLVAIDPALFGEAPGCAALDWAFIALGTAGAPTAWVAAHVLAERLTPDGWTPAPRAVLEEALACRLSGMRAALDRLVAADVVERRAQRGGVSAYRFTDRAWGVRADASSGWCGTTAATPARRSSASPPALPAAIPGARRSAGPIGGAPAAGAPPQRHQETGVQLSIGGVALDLAPGMVVRIELGVDGKPRLVVEPSLA